MAFGTIDESVLLDDEDKSTSRSLAQDSDPPDLLCVGQYVPVTYWMF